jgi:hypothetical protein
MSNKLKIESLQKDSTLFFNSTLVIVYYSSKMVNVNKFQIESHYKILNKYYPNMIIYTKFTDNNLAELENKMPIYNIEEDDFQGNIAEKTYLNAILKHNNPFYTGYILIHDDLLVNPKKLISLNKNHIWIGDKIVEHVLEPWDNPIINWNWFDTPYGIPVIKNILNNYSDNSIFIDQLRNCNDNNSTHIWYYASMDFVYFPSLLLDSFINTMKLFSKEQVFLEISVGTWAKCMTNNIVVEGLLLCTSWDARFRPYATKYYIYCNQNFDIIHPIKYTLKENFLLTHDLLSIWSRTDSSTLSSSYTFNDMDLIRPISKRVIYLYANNSFHLIQDHYVFMVGSNFFKNLIQFFIFIYFNYKYRYWI